MSRHLHRERIGLPTPRQRALVLLGLTNAGSQALNPVHGLFPRLRGRVPMPKVWMILTDLVYHGIATTDDAPVQSARFFLTSAGRTLAVREIQAELVRPRGARESSLRDDAAELGLKLPFLDVYRPPPDGAPGGHSGDGGNGTGEGRP